MTGPAGSRVKGFFITLNPEREKLIQQLEELRWKERWSSGQILMEAIREYVQRHLPGNPQMSLQTFTGQAPLPQTMTGAEPESELRKKIRALDEEYLRDKRG